MKLVEDTTFGGGLPSDGEATSGFFNLQKIRTQKKFVPRKSLGQNFLKSEPALKKIIEAGEVKKDDIILEIGPGRGKLTEKLLERAGLVIAVEKDRELFEFLKTKFEKEIETNAFVLIHGDVLNFDVRETILKFFSGPRISGSLSRPDHSKNLELLRYKIIANIPYNITGAILRKFLSAKGGSASGGKKFLTARNQPERMVLMVQKEVAERILGRRENISYSKPSHGRKLGKESILSISVKAYGEPKMIMKVPARYFSPTPQVDSAVILIKNISRKNFEIPAQPSPKERERFGASPFGGGMEGVNEERFWIIVKAGFAHKRKKLSGNLKNLVSLEKTNLAVFKDKRAEDLSLTDWILLARTPNL